MTISYNWLSEYLPETIHPDKLSKVLTSVGLEVESLEKYVNFPGGLKGLVVGQVMECEQHPNADKLKLTKVNVGNNNLLQIVCGAPNVAIGQKVIVAQVGTTIYPINNEPVTMKAAKIRGIESQGMICADDEIGTGASHEGIRILPDNIMVGTPVAEYFGIYEDWIYEIGLTPNRMDAMSHLGVAKDVCAYLSYHNKTESRPVNPFKNTFKNDNTKLPIKVTIENETACKRYAGITLSGVTVKESPDWLKNKLLAIGQRPINNIVDITNFILHETGQPLHAFDADAIHGNHIIVKNLPQDTIFITLDDKERRLSSEDLMICNAEEGMCIAGVFGGRTSGVKETTTRIFLESAWFDPATIRKTSFRHGLRTEAASRFEKGVDISNVVPVLKRATLLIKEIAGGEISSSITDVYPKPADKTQVALKYHYLKKLSGKNYHPGAVKKILTSLGFEVTKEGMDEIWVTVPFSKPDISLQADIVEEVLRIDGLDNVEIPSSITITPAIDENVLKEALKEKAAGYLTGIGFNEIVTNSITNSRYYKDEQLHGAVKMINSLSAELDVMRPSMSETGLEAIAYNLNRKNNDLLFYEFGKTYHAKAVGDYSEEERLALYLTGQQSNSWRTKNIVADFYKAKGIAEAVLKLCGIEDVRFNGDDNNDFPLSVQAKHNNKLVATIAEVSQAQLQTFNIKQPVYFVDINWRMVLQQVAGNKITFKEVAKFPAVQRDLAIIIDRSVNFREVESSIENARLPKLKEMKLFDVFESEKIGAGKKSFAISFTFIDEEKTLTDKETDEMMNKIIGGLEKDLSAEVRKN